MRKPLEGKKIKDKCSICGEEMYRQPCMHCYCGSKKELVKIWEHRVDNEGCSCCGFSDYFYQCEDCKDIYVI